MARYIDSGSGDSQDAVGTWLTNNFNADIDSFRCQMGYFTYGTIYPFQELIHDLVSSHRPVHLVLGSNKASLVQSHLEWTFELIRGGKNASLTVVAFSNAEFHPKTLHLGRKDGSATAVVGSANMTEAGFGLNVEAGVILDTRENDSPQVLTTIQDAIDRWQSQTMPGVFPIVEVDDILALKEAGIIDEPQPIPPRPGHLGDADEAGGPQVGTRVRLWTPSHRPPRQPVAATTPTSTPVAPASTSAATLRWWKQLAASDAQQVRVGSHPTGKLRLAQAGFPIDHRRYFRYQMFGDQNWTTETRGANSYDVASIPFNVTARGVNRGIMTLTVDHAPHREASQNNVPTILAWGPLNAMLTATPHVGDWVKIEKLANGTFNLTIDRDEPV